LTRRPQARSLKELGSHSEAVKALETAESISQEHTSVIQKYKAEIIQAQGSIL
jgi:hypothetical protein